MCFKRHDDDGPHTVMIGAVAVGHLTARSGQTLPRPTNDEFYAPFKQLQHVRVAHTVKSRLGNNDAYYQTLAALKSTQHAHIPT